MYSYHPAIGKAVHHNPLLITALLLCLCIKLMAGESRTVDAPAFVACNTSALQIKSIQMDETGTCLEIEMQADTSALAGAWIEAEGKHSGLKRIEVKGGMSKDTVGGKRNNLRLLFDPLPAGVQVIDLILPRRGWRIWGIQLRSILPYVYLPDFLQTMQPDEKQDFPPMLPADGDFTLNGYILGYDERMGGSVTVMYDDFLFPHGGRLTAAIASDGSFHLEAPLLFPTLARLHLYNLSLPLFIAPGSELSLYLDLPVISMQAHGPATLKQRLKRTKGIWFDGTYAGINTAFGKKPEKTYVLQAPSPSLRKNMEALRPLCGKIEQHISLSTNERKQLDDFPIAAVRHYIETRSKAFSADWQIARSRKAPVVIFADSTLRGKVLLQSLLRPFRGHVLLVDFWATWCGPCAKARVATQPLRKSLTHEDVLYMYIADHSSPFPLWNKTIAGIPGIHCRISRTQWNSLCKAFGIKGIPAYFIIDAQGNLRGQYTGFPGVDILRQKLLQK